jgi:IBR domain, a half RING-finger domain/Zinc finger, C3HC4 type (RING finger)/RNA recognition motif. (a.k.a. RRM, RBD, or RNP domain)
MAFPPGPPVWENITQMPSPGKANASAPTNGLSVPQVQRQRVENASSSPQSQVTRASAAAPTTVVKLDPAVITASVGTSPLHPLAQHPPTLLQTTASAISNKEVLPQQPPQKLDVPSPFNKPPSDITLLVMEATKVGFSGGFSIAKIVTGFETLWFAIEGVPVATKRDAIERLVAPFGTVQDVRFRDESRNADSSLTVVTVQMASYREVVRAISGLDGTNVFGHPITVQLSLSHRLTKRMIRDNFVRIRWPVPSKAGYAGYSTLEAAQKAVSNADGMTRRKYWITASMYEGIPVVGAYNVRFTGLPPDTTPKFFNQFGPTEDTMMERPNYQSPDFGIPAVRRILEGFGKITTFQPVPPPYKDGMVRVWCRFELPDVAAAACELHRVKQRSLSMVKISVQRVLSVQEKVPRAKFELIEQDLQRLRQDVWKHIPGAHLDILSHREGEDPAVRLVAEDSKTLARLRVELSEILNGEILKENGQQVWDDFLRLDAGTHFLDDLRVRDPRITISVHIFRRCIRLIGTVERRKSVAAAILEKLSSLQQHKVRTIQLDEQLKGILLSPDLMAAQRRHGEENIHLDSQRQVLRVRGSEKLYEEVQQIIHTVQSRLVASEDDHCPVCLEPPFAPVSLNCGHKWCKSCLVAYLNAASDTRSFPISCLGNQGRCAELVPVKEAKSVLPPADFDALALAAFHVYVQSHPEDYHYCPTPDCPQAYPSGPRDSIVSCPSCLARICPYCHVEYHEGVTCADREDGGDRLFEEWMRTHGVKKCPGCQVPIERSEGCNHMTCTRCHTHTCWVCLDTFPEGQGIYDHMREFHGGIGL